jgi:SAM-dependent methyltransferase
MIHPYRWLAHYYDEIFSASRSPMDRARERILGRILPRVESACDLACGTGTTALALARKGIRMYGVDLSPHMCRLARENARRAGLTVLVLRGDMRSFRLPQKVDLITCEFDALNHVPQRAELGRVARAVKRALRPGGYFFFDVNNSLGFKRYWTGTVWVEKPHVVLVMRNGHNAQASRAWVDVEWFVREGTCWQRKHERVEEVCWTSDEIRHIFRKAGFDWVRAWDAAPFFKDNSVVRRGCRTIYLVCNTRS